MHYMIDGYNLLFRIFNAKGDLQTQREELVLNLAEKIGFLELNVSLIFDSHSQHGDRSRSHFHSLEICFTNEGETADTYILSKLECLKHPNQEIVVTSDKKLAWEARLYSAKTQTTETFLSWINQRYDSHVHQKKKQKHVPTDRASSSSPKKIQKDPEIERWLRIFEEQLKRKE